MADVAAHVEGVVTADSAGGGGEGVGGTEHDTAGLDGVLALEDNADDGAGEHWRSAVYRGGGNAQSRTADEVAYVLVTGFRTV